ncbi:DHA2 family efflux MFS transporter permease subunit [Hahella sp. CCB-MM4]|uniref:DHA2 family efflux MFS transporter permease subunit n=1 Tax=Hahella sp. (strain CCB-MM4) TaxID=1926491 RepID=UPI001FEF1A1B|nr:DHA2 family efflux MFS transporter permease subunit [Hahella sp. CCB-MM4]
MTVLFGTVTVSLNNSALNPAVPEFMTAFSIGPITAGWIITGFLIGMGMTMPITGFLSHRFSKRTVYLTGLTLFICGSIAGTFTTTMPWVIAARVFQGIAGGLMIPLSLALIFAVYPKEQRGRVTGIWGTAVMLAPAVGPAVGGVMLQFYSWHVLFAMNIPTGLLGLFVGFYCLPADEGQKDRSFDWIGFLLVTSGVGLLLFVLSQFRDQTALTSPVNLTLITLALLCLVAFVRVEISKQEPLLCLQIFAIPSYSLSVVVAVVQTVGMFGCIMILPLLMQTVLGHGPVWTGLALLTTAVFASAFVNLGGKTLDTRGPRGVVCIGLLFTALATIAFGLIDNASPLWMIFLLMMARGIGIGLSYMPVTTAGLNAIPEHLVAQGAAMNNILRRIAASIAIVLMSIYFEVRSANLRTGGTPSDISGLTAINEIFTTVGLLILLALPLAWLLPGSAPHQSKKWQKNRLKAARINFRLSKSLLLKGQTASNQKLNKVET